MGCVGRALMDLFRHTSQLVCCTTYVNVAGRMVCNMTCHGTNKDESQQSRISIHHLTLQHTTTHCNTLQHAATRCNTLQHAATHLSRCLDCLVHLHHVQYTHFHLAPGLLTVLHPERREIQRDTERQREAERDKGHAMRDVTHKMWIIMSHDVCIILLQWLMMCVSYVTWLITHMAHDS